MRNRAQDIMAFLKMQPYDIKIILTLARIIKKACGIAGFHVFSFLKLFVNDHHLVDLSHSCRV